MSHTTEVHQALLSRGCVYSKEHTILLPFSFEPPVRLYNGTQGACSMGAFSYSVGRLYNIEMGRYCSVALGVEALTDHPTDFLTSSPICYQTVFPEPWAKPAKFPESFQPYKTVKLGHDVWVGANAKLRGGIEIGTGAIIAAGAVVVKDVPPYAIVGGVPAKLIRWRFDEALREKLLASKWWQYNLTGLELDFSQPEKSLEQLQALIKEGLKPYKPKWTHLKP